MTAERYSRTGVGPLLASVHNRVVAAVSRFHAKFADLGEAIGLVWSETVKVSRIQLVCLVILTVVTSLLGALGPVALKVAVDSFTAENGRRGWSAVVAISLYVLCSWLARTAGEIRAVVYTRIERRALRVLSERMLAHFLRLRLRVRLEWQTSTVDQTLSNGLRGFQMVLCAMLLTIFPVCMELGTIAVVVTRLNPIAFVGLFCGALVCYALSFAYAARQIADAAEGATSSQSEAHAAVTDCVLNVEAVKYFTAEGLVQKRVDIALARTEQAWVGVARRCAFNNIWSAAVFAIFLASTMLLAAREVQDGYVPVGSFVLVNIFMCQLAWPVQALGYALQSALQGLVHIQNAVELLRQEVEEQGGAATCPKSGPGMVEFQRVGFSYRGDGLTLRDVSFRVPAGKTVGIVGSSGSGKSTLMRLLVRFIEPDCGQILLDGVPIRDLPLAEVRNAVAVVPQETFLFDETVAYNIAFGKSGSSPEEVVWAAKLACMHEFIMSLPEGYETKVGERGFNLSGGERQRLSIARAAIKQPRIYVFDEGTSSLDSDTEREVLRNLRALSRSCTTVVIAHRLSTVVHADEICVLERGKIIEQGTHAALLRSNGRYAALWEFQRQGTVAA